MRFPPPVGPFSSPVPRDLWWSWVGGYFLRVRYPYTPLFRNDAADTGRSDLHICVRAARLSGRARCAGFRQ